MELDRYVEELRTQLVASPPRPAANDARALAERLTAPLDVTRASLCSKSCLTPPARSPLDLAPGSVEVCLRGRDPEIVVTPPPLEETTPSPGADDSSDHTRDLAPTATFANVDDDSGTARITLRLPEDAEDPA